MAMSTNETRESCRAMPLIDLLEYYDDLVEQSRRQMAARMNKNREG